MSDSFATLMAHRQELDRQIASMQRESRASAIAEIHALMHQTDRTLADIAPGAGTPGSGPRRGSASGAELAAKYRDDATGNSRSGRGSRPGWLSAALAAGAKLEDFAV